MKTVSKYALSILLLLALSLPAAAQQPPAELSVRVADVDVSAFPQVALTITVRDANGVPVPDLDPRAFEVNEDRVPEALDILSVEPVVNPELPVSLLLIVDVSGSMAGQPLADAQAAARALIDQLGAGDEVAFIAFADAVDLDGLNPAREHPPTSDRRVVLALVDGLEARGGTPLYDALYKGVQWAQEASLGHRAVILLTDGVDEDPGSAVASQETPIQAATRANVPVFTIGLGSGIDRGYLERVARATGGTYQETPDSAQLTELFLNVLTRLKQQYVVAYESGLAGDGETHRVTVTARVGDRQAEHEAEFVPPVDGTPRPTALPETPVPQPTSPPSTTVPHPDPSPSRAVSWLPIAGGAVGLGLLALLVLGLRRRRAVKRRDEQEYCMDCGRPLDPGQVCPDCGPDAGRFKKPRGV
ncbi:MAG: VWA domain-containing protein [Anaerolineae bacterium]|nr:VWA domain-containing protein [Anaerolineae bacterium]